MKAASLLPALALFAGLGLAPALAANADHPDQNVDKRNDAGGDTGNSQVDRLNSGQLDGNQPSAAGRPIPAPGQPGAPGQPAPAPQR